MTNSLVREGLVLAIIVLFIGAGVAPAISGSTVPSLNEGHWMVIIDSENEAEIFKEIEETVDKVLVVDEIIGDRHVKYWEHIVNDVYIKNDSILLHMDIENHNILRYERSWTEIDIDLLPALDDLLFEPEDYFWKKAVIFMDNNDCTCFYIFHESQEFPLLCWEVRHNDGTTIMYDFYGYEIGYGTPAPSSGFLLSGYHNESLPDPWLNYRLNAEYWFDRWCTLTTGISAPTPATISSYVSNSNYELFYEMAHGNYWVFQATSNFSYHSFELKNDMDGRSPMKFAFIGSCDGMSNTGPGSFSYEFRKGQTTDTVTVGFSGMGSCPGSNVAFEWQDFMFNKMDEGFTIKESFDLASAEFPTIADCVVFVGDVNLTADENQNPHIPTIMGPASGKAGTSNNYNFVSIDPDGDDVSYYIEWSDDSNSGWIGPYESDEEIVVSHTWDRIETYRVRVKAKDIYGEESEWGYLEVTIPKSKAFNINPMIQRFMKNHLRMFPVIRQQLGL